MNFLNLLPCLLVVYNQKMNPEEATKYCAETNDEYVADLKNCPGTIAKAYKANFDMCMHEESGVGSRNEVLENYKGLGTTTRLCDEERRANTSWGDWVREKVGLEKTQATNQDL